MPFGGEARASDRNVLFPYDAALEAARALWHLSIDVESHIDDLGYFAAPATEAWLGPKRYEFDWLLEARWTTAHNVRESLQSTARELARAWSEARGQQDRINLARWAEHELESENLLEKGRDFFFGQPKHETWIDNPPHPSEPTFYETRQPIHPEFEFWY